MEEEEEEDGRQARNEGSDVINLLVCSMGERTARRREREIDFLFSLNVKKIAGGAVVSAVDVHTEW